MAVVVMIRYDDNTICLITVSKIMLNSEKLLSFIFPKLPFCVQDELDTFTILKSIPIYLITENKVN